MKRISTIQAVGILIAVGALTAVPAVIHGRIMNRWGMPADLQVGAARVQNFPTQIGDWKRVRDEELDRTVTEELKCAGYVNRQYVNEKTGREISLLLFVGTPGPLVRHPPEICYGNRANTLLRGPEQITIGDSNETFRALRYKAPGPTGSEFTIVYAWSDREHWSVPDYPRTEFGGEPMLYKLQVLSTDLVEEGKILPASCEQFLQSFVQAAASGTL
ncbi:MAG: exosortase-associated EpsI family protein [Planctomycetaceae bacterium]